MFEFLKHRPKHPRPIFAPLETDIHCHLLPCVDDGSKSLEESTTCFHIMRAAGFKNVVCTPHFQYPRFENQEDDIKARYAQLVKDITANAALSDLNLAGIGGEYRVDAGFNERLKKCNFLLVGGKYLLIEFSLHQQVLGLDEILFDLQMRGFDIILAHPERYPYFGSHSSRLEHFKEMGIYFQTNILSLSGFYGEGARKKAYEMMDDGWIEFLGTDMHNCIYAQALIDASHDRKIEHLVERNAFLNKELLASPTKTKKKF